MSVHGFQLPARLAALLAAGKWTRPDALAGGMIDLGPGCARCLSKDDDQLVLMPPPFHTIADEIVGGNEWWNTGLTNAGEIDYSKAVIIADFGMGSDSPIILYYGRSPEPSVMYLKWSGNGAGLRHSWVQTHASFDDFANAVGL
jgi:hypothetical protein